MIELLRDVKPSLERCLYLRPALRKRPWLEGRRQWSALDHIELTYHDVTVFAIPEFKSLEVLKKLFFMIISLYINPKTSHNQILILTIKKKL